MVILNSAQQNGEYRHLSNLHRVITVSQEKRALEEESKKRVLHNYFDCTIIIRPVNVILQSFQKTCIDPLHAEVHLFVFPRDEETEKKGKSINVTDVEILESIRALCTCHDATIDESYDVIIYPVGGVGGVYRGWVFRYTT